ncbi:MAG: outer membrane protein [Maribacter sp.]|jgi:outer membrane protein
MKTVILTLIVTIVSILGLHAQNNRSFSIHEAVEYGVNNNLDIREAQINVTDADQRVIEAKSMGIPQANLTMDYKRFLKLPVTVLPDEFGMNPTTGMIDPNFNNEVAFGVKNSFNANIEVSSLLFDGSYLVGLQAAKMYTDQASLQLDATRDDVASRVRDAYLPALIIAENRKILEKNIINLDKLLFETKEMYKAGFVEQLDVDRLELSKANLEAEMDNLTNKEELSLNFLKFTMGYPVEDNIEISDNLEGLISLPTDKDLAGEIDYSERIEYTLVQSAVALNEMNVKRFRAGYLPQLIAYGSYGVIRQGNRIREGSWSDNSVVGVRLNVPIFDGFNKKAKVERAKLQLEIIKNSQQKLENAIEIEVKNARSNYRNAQDRLKSREKNLVLAEKIYNTSQIKYKEGIGSSLEISQAEQALFQTQSNYINAKYQLLVAKVELDKSLGR